MLLAIVKILPLGLCTPEDGRYFGDTIRTEGDVVRREGGEEVRQWPRLRHFEPLVIYRMCFLSFHILS